MKLSLVLILAVALAGCGDEGGEDPPRATGPLVTFERGGGIAHQPKTLVVERDGSATLTSRVGTDTATTDLRIEGTGLEELEELVAAAEGATEPENIGACSDCFIFTVIATGIDVTVDQVTIEDADPELRALVARLSGLTGQ